MSRTRKLEIEPRKDRAGKVTHWVVVVSGRKVYGSRGEYPTRYRDAIAFASGFTGKPLLDWVDSGRAVFRVFF